MNFLNYIKKLEIIGIISWKALPVLLVVLAFVSLVLGFIVFYMNVDKIWAYAFFFLAGFSFIFAILHFIVVRFLEKKWSTIIFKNFNLKRKL